MKKCDKCKLELSLYHVTKEVVDGVEIKKKVYVCRNKSCSQKEIYELEKGV